MGKTISSLLSLCLVAALQTGCAQPDPHPMAMTQAVQTATTSSDHLALARHFEEAAQAAQTRLAEHQQLLTQYKAKSFLYGKNIYRLEEHCDVLIRNDEQSVDANRKLAELHRELAQTATMSP